MYLMLNTFCSVLLLCFIIEFKFFKFKKNACVANKHYILHSMCKHVVGTSYDVYSTSALDDNEGLQFPSTYHISLMDSRCNYSIFPLYHY